MNKQPILSRICGLQVRTQHIKGKGASYYMFGPPGQEIKSMYGYKKARLFAEGYAAGFLAAQLLEARAK